MKFIKKDYARLMIDRPKDSRMDITTRDLYAKMLLAVRNRIVKQKEDTPKIVDICSRMKQTDPDPENSPMDDYEDDSDEYGYDEDDEDDEEYEDDDDNEESIDR